MTAQGFVLVTMAATLLFGASIPFAKQLTGNISPVLLAGLLYLGSGIGMWLVRLVRDRGFTVPNLPKKEWPWLLGAIASGGVLGPILLMFGLTSTTSADASLLLNLETVLTAMLAWVVFRENADRRVVVGMTFIVAGGVVLTWQKNGAWGSSGVLGALAISVACLCWAVDNNLTRKVSTCDAVFIAGTKGMIAGATNLALALAFGTEWPAWQRVAEAMGIGLAGYGVSLMLFVLALRGLGAARTGAYFSTAPFMGAVIAVVGFDEPTSLAFWLAAALMTAGVWLHLTERHEHVHTHELLTHTHRHTHDEHHTHPHDFLYDGLEPHAHKHRHDSITHSHPYYPDVHHRHDHW
jgi:drug/metabolite transporter (DMT)-like permease